MAPKYRSARDERPAADDTPEQLKAKTVRRQQKAELRVMWYEQHAWHPHQARHRAATIQLRHTTEKMARRYAQADFDKAKQAIENAA